MSTPDIAQARPLRLVPPIGFSLFALGFLVIVGGATALALRFPVAALTFNTGAFTNLGQVFAPMLLISAFVERAVEVVLTPLRGNESDRLQTQLDAATKDGTTDAATLLRLQNEMNGFRHRTREIAFTLSTGLGLAAALCGVRGFASLLQTPGSATQAFHTFDILMTGVVIGGGADGIHAIVGAVLDYMNMISQKAQTAAKASS